LQSSFDSFTKYSLLSSGNPQKSL